jgi:hypothetical protein
MPRCTPPSGQAETRCPSGHPQIFVPRYGLLVRGRASDSIL